MHHAATPALTHNLGDQAAVVAFLYLSPRANRYFETTKREGSRSCLGVQTGCRSSAPRGSAPNPRGCDPARDNGTRTKGPESLRAGGLVEHSGATWAKGGAHHGAALRRRSNHQREEFIMGKRRRTSIRVRENDMVITFSKADGQALATRLRKGYGFFGDLDITACTCAAIRESDRPCAWCETHPAATAEGGER